MTSNCIYWLKALAVSVLMLLSSALWAATNTADTKLAEQKVANTELKQLLDQEKDKSRQLEIQSLKEQVAAAVNNSQKAADWWINATGVLLTIVGLVVAVLGVFVPFVLTRNQRRKLDEQEKTLTALTTQVTEAATSIQSQVQKAQADVAVIEQQKNNLLDAANLDPAKVAPGTPEALKVQNALAAASDQLEKDQPIDVQLRLRALAAQAKNEWATALSLWQQLLDKDPDNGLTLLALGNAHISYAQQQVSPEEQKRVYMQAIAHFHQAIVRLSGLNYAEAQNNLGNALATLGQRESDPEQLQAAVSAFREALKERTRERVPLGWAMTQNNLGNALATLGQRESGPEQLQEAVSAYLEALKEYTRERVPLDWAMTHNNLGSALQTLGQRESDPELLQAAVSTYREALKERTRARVPLD
jgi:tetratricopeptide (TPR) repeat protein